MSRKRTMHWKVRMQFLSRVEVFADLGRRDFKALAKSCTEAVYQDGEALCRQGERGVTAFILISGEVTVENETGDGEIVTVAELGQGAIVGELSIIDGAERVATVRARGEVEALVLTQWSMIALLKSRPSIAVAMLPVIVARFRDTAQDLLRRDNESEQGRKSVYQ
ncbi:MAG: cyclic nucleotide-binding domain-containing protein [Deltaproteobacteria bacterium]|nr:cyclic nucleotide-binding domain-containing protein [Deltaproteobacteria bacterium]